PDGARTWGQRGQLEPDGRCPRLLDPCLPPGSVRRHLLQQLERPQCLTRSLVRTHLVGEWASAISGLASATRSRRPTGGSASPSGMPCDLAGDLNDPRAQPVSLGRVELFEDLDGLLPCSDGACGRAGGVVRIAKPGERFRLVQRDAKTVVDLDRLAIRSDGLLVVAEAMVHVAEDVHDRTPESGITDARHRQGRSAVVQRSMMVAHLRVKPSQRAEDIGAFLRHAVGRKYLQRTLAVRQGLGMPALLAAQHHPDIAQYGCLARVLT